MARPLKILSINFPFKSSSVVQDGRISTVRALFDFDVVVIRPHDLERSHPRQGGLWDDYERLKEEYQRKREDLVRLLGDGKLLVLILDVRDVLELDTGGYGSSKKHTVTNYHFLHDRLFESIRNGVGDRFEITDQAEPFSSVLRSSTIKWTSFAASPLPYDLHGTRVFARNGVGSFVGGVLDFSPGHVVFLPNFLELDEPEFFNACRQHLFVGEEMPAPPWVAGVRLPGESEAVARVKSAERQVEESQEKLREAVADFGSLVNHKKLLFEKGKGHLEPAVRKALDDLGFATTPSEEIPGTNYEIDGRTTVGSASGILEVKGSKKQIPLDEFSTFVIKILADLQQTQEPSKGILVGNGLCLEDPANRVGERVFTQHVLDAARQNSVALINSVELYWLVIGIAEGVVKDCDSIREKILASNGYVDLRPYCGSCPFVASAADPKMSS